MVAKFPAMAIYVDLLHLVFPLFEFSWWIYQSLLVVSAGTAGIFNDLNLVAVAFS